MESLHHCVKYDYRLSLARSSAKPIYVVTAIRPTGNTAPAKSAEKKAANGLNAFAELARDKLEWIALTAVWDAGAQMMMTYRA